MISHRDRIIFTIEYRNPFISSLITEFPDFEQIVLSHFPEKINLNSIFSLSTDFVSKKVFEKDLRILDVISHSVYKGYELKGLLESSFFKNINILETYEITELKLQERSLSNISYIKELETHTDGSAKSILDYLLSLKDPEAFLLKRTIRYGVDLYKKNNPTLDYKKAMAHWNSELMIEKYAPLIKKLEDAIMILDKDHNN